jgi:transcriptional regulator with XRE-family HTH domain
MSDRLPSPVDRHVASRVRLRRREAGLTQQMVADTLDVTFQQFQKYERAINRISAGTLYQLAIALEVPVQYFFEGFKAGRKKVPLATKGRLSRAISQRSMIGHA